jgi:predicted acyl esterase
MSTAYPADWNVSFTPAKPLPENYEFGRKTIVYPAGSTNPPLSRALPCDVQLERDIPVKLRDGSVIYTDVLLPAGNTARLPAIVSWSPYGKTLPQAALPSVPPDWYSGFSKAEAPDAAFWIANGYALVNPDARGAWMSEGDIQFLGIVEASDGYDLIEWVAQQPWSNGKIGMQGNSWLVMSMWGIAATNPPHLEAIAPWNGIDDLHRDHLFQGGIPDVAFSSMVLSGFVGRNQVEDAVAAMQQSPFRNPYWEDKRPPVEKITVPVYETVDGATTLHNMGGFDAWRRLGSQQKWLRVNNTNEWYDQYDPANEQDLKRFFDRYLKGEENGWEETPRVRISIMDPNGTGSTDTVNTPFEAFPIPGTRYEKLYLNGTDGSLSKTPPGPATASYDAQTGHATFTITFNENTQLIGYLKARLYVEAQGADDMDLFVRVEKLDQDGTPLVPSQLSLPYFYPNPLGSSGRLRVSMRDLDKNLSTDFNPVYALTTPRKLSPGEVVPVDVALLPIELRWHAGQTLRLTVGGHYEGENVLPIPTITIGTDVIHTGGSDASYLQVPVVTWE